MSDATPCVFMWWIVLDNFGSILFVISSSDFVYRGHNWLKGICNFSPLISSAVKLLKHMLHHLPNLRCPGFPFLVPFQHCILTHVLTEFYELVCFYRFQEMIILLFLFHLRQRPSMLDRLHQSYILLSLVPSQVNLLYLITFFTSL